MRGAQPRRWRHLLERVHPQRHVHPGAVGQEGSQSRFLKQAKDQDLIPARKQLQREGVTAGHTAASRRTGQSNGRGNSEEMSNIVRGR